MSLDQLLNTKKCACKWKISIQATSTYVVFDQAWGARSAFNFLDLFKRLLQIDSCKRVYFKYSVGFVTAGVII